jgi:hypothetical protein
MATNGDPHPDTAPIAATSDSDDGGVREPDEALEALTALQGAAAAIHELHRHELADERPPAQRWEREIADLHQVLSAARNLMVALGNSCPLYAPRAQWRGGTKPPDSTENAAPALELMDASSKILSVHDALHQPLMDLHLAQLRLAQLTFDHDQPSIWDTPTHL